MIGQYHVVEEGQPQYVQSVKTYDPHKYMWGGLSLDYYDHSTSPLYITLQSSQIEGRMALDILALVTKG